MDEFCPCGKLVVSRTSWSDLNPGRRYKACNQFRNGGCEYFVWVDPPACERCHQIIPGLLRNINSKVEELDVQKKKVEELEQLMKKRILRLTIVLVAVMVLLCSFLK